jgi:protein-tyrosine-phosphatase
VPVLVGGVVGVAAVGGVVGVAAVGRAAAGRDETGVAQLAQVVGDQVLRLADQEFDWVISLCDRVREVCPEFPGDPTTIHWSIPDPAAGQADDDASYPAFEQLAVELETRIGFLLAVITNGTPAT